MEISISNTKEKHRVLIKVGKQVLLDREYYGSKYKAKNSALWACATHMAGGKNASTARIRHVRDDLNAQATIDIKPVVKQPSAEEYRRAKYGE